MSSIEAIAAMENGILDIGLVRYPQNKTTLNYKPLIEIHDTFVATQNYLDNFSKRYELTNESLLENATFMMLDKENVFFRKRGCCCSAGPRSPNRSPRDDRS